MKFLTIMFVWVVTAIFAMGIGMHISEKSDPWKALVHIILTIWGTISGIGLIR